MMALAIWPKLRAALALEVEISPFSLIVTSFPGDGKPVASNIIGHGQSDQNEKPKKRSAHNQADDGAFEKSVHQKQRDDCGLHGGDHHGDEHIHPSHVD